MSTSIDPISLEKETVRRVKWHILPFMMVGMVTCFLDRVNIGFAALQMNADLHLSPAAFGFAAGVFFLGYFVFEVPSNLMMAKFGPRIWLTRIMLTWGIIAGVTAFATSAFGLYVIRFLLGIAEAGFFPGLVLYVTYWFRGRDHAHAVSWILVGSYTASLIAGPLSGYLLGWGALGLRGWQWLFIVEGLIPIAFGVVLWLFWTDRPEQAKWLKPEQKEWLVKSIAAENAAKETPRRIGVREALTRPGTLVLFSVYFLQGMGNLGMLFWMPQIFKSVGKDLTPVQIGLLTMLPSICLIIGLLFWSHHSDSTGERHWHCVGASLVGCLGLYCFPFATSVPLVVLAICLAGLGIGGAQGVFWSAATALLGKREAAAGLALINSGAALGGFTGPYVTGIARGIFGNYQAAMFILASALFLVAVIMHAFFVKTGTGRVKEVKVELQT
jgi:ACS family tartrate transporter-like MFS transporter